MRNLLKNLRRKRHVLKPQRSDEMHHHVGYAALHAVREHMPHTKKQWVFTISGTNALLLLLIVGTFLLPRTLSFDFGDENCVFNPSLFPASDEPVDVFQAIPVSTLSVGSTDIFSSKTCIKALEIPTQKVYEVEMKSLGFLKKTFSIDLDQLPTLSFDFNTEQKLSSNGQLLFSTDMPDTVFAYRLTHSEDTVDCINSGTQVLCDISGLKLPQGTKSEVSILRVLGSQTKKLETFSLHTLEPVKIAKSSLARDELVYTQLDSITLTADKPIAEVKDATLTNTSTNTRVSISTSIEGATLTIKSSELLPRESNFELAIPNMSAQDGSHLGSVYKLRFKTSGGPTPNYMNIGYYDAPSSGSYVITFDQSLKSGQKLGDYVSLVAGGKAISANITASGRHVTVRPSAPLGRCAGFEVQVKPGFLSVNDVTSTKSWSRASRTTCHSVSSIGQSVQGRSLTSYTFGSGSKTIVFVGGMHGDEYNTVSTLESWIDELERNYHDIPSDKKVVVIPNLNPDGRAAGSRFNANGVDLNRNFPADDWQSETYYFGDETLENGGGSAPLSEPESAALAAFINATSPRLVLTYHNPPFVVIANGSGDSMTLASLYGSKSGMPARHTGSDDEQFGYPTTGEFEDWLHDKKAIPALLVELAYTYTNRFNTNRSAMWAMLDI